MRIFFQAHNYSFSILNRTSARNCARVYNETFTVSHGILPPTWQFRTDINVEDVWNTFFLHALLLDSAENSLVLELPHDAISQATRLDEAIHSRNLSISGTGQEHWNHACELCCWIHNDPDGHSVSLRSVVIDGVTVGHPCCNVHNCTTPLASMRDRFCPDHRQLDRVCVVTDCDQSARPGTQTCTISTHKALEDYYQEQGKAMFQLRLRLERARARADNGASESQLPGHNSGTVDDINSDIDISSDMLCEGKPEAGNRRLKARFGRRWTHNDELCTASCGIILGRMTFFGSEAPNGVRV